MSLLSPNSNKYNICIAGYSHLCVVYILYTFYIGLLSETSDPQISSHLLLGASCSDNQEDSLTDVGDGSSNEYFSLNRMEFEGISMLRRESQTSDYYSLKDGTPGQCFSASLYEGDSVHGDNTDNDTISNSMASVINSSFDEYLE